MAALRNTCRLAARSSQLLNASAATSSRVAARQTLRQQARRGYASEASSGSGGSTLVGVVIGAAAGAAGAYYYFTSATPAGDAKAAKDAAVGAFKASINSLKHIPKSEDYQAVYNAIAKRLEEHDQYDDGSYGPVLVRLAWHCSGTYDVATKTGGSNGATMRFDPEGEHGANSGLAKARDFLYPIKEEFPWITYSDLWTLAGVAAIQEMQGPQVPWRPGRSDRDSTWCTPDGRLPDASKEQKHLRAIFGRMGFNDQEIVALSGAHALGRCHTDRSGFEGPWTFSPTVVTNDYYRLLLEEKWNVRKWDGPKQFQDDGSKTLMMLPTDLALVGDKSFKKWVEKYAKDNDLFFNDFSNVICKLFELGVPFNTAEASRLTFKKLEEAK